MNDQTSMAGVTRVKFILSASGSELELDTRWMTCVPRIGDKVTIVHKLSGSRRPEVTHVVVDVRHDCTFGPTKVNVLLALGDTE